MSDLKTQIENQVRQTKADMDEIKQAIKHRAAKGSSIAELEQRLKEIHTRLRVLETNFENAE